MELSTHTTLAAALLALSASTVSAQTGVRDVLQAVKPSTPKVIGLLNVRYAYDSKDESNGFDIRRVRLGISGDFGKHIDYKVQAEYGGGSASSAASVKLLDAFLRVKIAKPINIQVGEYKVAYSQETLDGPATWLTIENPTAVNKLNGYSDESGMHANSRDIGLTLYGTLAQSRGRDIVTYRLGVFNGNGINLKDNDSRKDISAYLTVSPIKSLTLSAAHYAGHYTTTSGQTTATLRRDRTSAGLTFSEGAFRLRSEYLHGKTGERSHQGVYAIASYNLPYGLQPVLSYGYYQKDTDTKRDNQSDYLIGLNWQPLKYLRLQLDYTLTNYTNSSKDNSSLLETQVVLSM